MTGPRRFQSTETHTNMHCAVPSVRPSSLFYAFGQHGTVLAFPALARCVIALAQHEAARCEERHGD